MFYFLRIFFSKIKRITSSFCFVLFCCDSRQISMLRCHATKRVCKCGRLNAPLIWQFIQHNVVRKYCFLFQESCRTFTTKYLLCFLPVDTYFFLIHCLKFIRLPKKLYIKSIVEKFDSMIYRTTNRFEIFISHMNLKYWTY